MAWLSFIGGGGAQVVACVYAIYIVKAQWVHPVGVMTERKGPQR